MAELLAIVALLAPGVAVECSPAPLPVVARAWLGPENPRIELNPASCSALRHPGRRGFGRYLFVLLHEVGHHAVGRSERAATRFALRHLRWALARISGVHPGALREAVREGR